MDRKISFSNIIFEENLLYFTKRIIDDETANMLNL